MGRNAGARDQVDDAAPAPALEHRACERPRQPQRAEQVRLEHGLPDLVADVEHVEPVLQPGRVRVVDEDVDVAEALERLGGQPVDVAADRHVGERRLDAPPGRLAADRLGRSLQPLRRARDEQHVGAAQANDAAIAAPMFLLAPVTSATCPSSRSASGAMPSVCPCQPCITVPVETLRSSPVIADAASEQRKRTAAATSSAVVKRPSGGRRAAGRGPPSGGRLEPLALDRPRRDEVDAHAGGAGVARERAHEPDERGLARRIGGALGQRPLAGHRPDHDDAPAALLHHLGDERAAAQEHAGDVGAQRRLPSGDGQLPRRGDRAGDPRHRDERLGGAPAVGDRRGQTLDGGGMPT